MKPCPRRDPPDRKGVLPAKSTPEEKKHLQEPIAKPLVPQGDLPNYKAANELAWFLYEKTLSDPDGRRMVDDMLKVAQFPKALLGAAFLAGATCAALELECRQFNSKQGNN